MHLPLDKGRFFCVYLQSFWRIRHTRRLNSVRYAAYPKLKSARVGISAFFDILAVVHIRLRLRVDKAETPLDISHPLCIVLVRTHQFSGRLSGSYSVRP